MVQGLVSEQGLLQAPRGSTGEPGRGAGHGAEVPALTCTMFSLGSRLQSAKVSWSPSRKRRREARRWGSWASSCSRGALRNSSKFSRARSRFRCSAAEGWQHQGPSAVLQLLPHAQLRVQLRAWAQPH